MTKINSTIQGIMALDSGDDPWGWALQHAFALAELQVFRGDARQIPDGLGFSASPVMTDVHTDEWPDTEYAEEFAAGKFTTDDIEYTLRVLDKYLDLCKMKGLDY